MYVNQIVTVGQQEVAELNQVQVTETALSGATTAGGKCRLCHGAGKPYRAR